MNPRLTDHDVAGLPLSQARAELLEEIVATSPQRSGVRVLTPRRTRWVAVPAAAAAVVLAAVAVPMWLSDGGGGRRPAPAVAPTGAATSTAPAAPVAHEWVALEADGWVVTYVSDSHGEKEVRYENGRASLDVHLRRADTRESYVADRGEVGSSRPDPGTPVTLLDEDALLWPYSPRDHTTIGAVDGEVFPEVRGSGMPRAAYLELLGQLSWADDPGFERTLPDAFVTDAERDEVIAEMTEDMALPPGLEIESDELDRYHLGARVAGTVACAWLDQYAEARESGDVAAAEEAQQALAGSTSWSILVEMAAEGGYSEGVWGYAAQVGEGRVPEGYQDGLGCP